MVAELLAVGTELLMGQISNTNAQYISKRLSELGINVYYHTVVGDNPIRLKETLLKALHRSDIVITTGGLGPTRDDLTKETIAEALNKPMVLHPEILDKLKAFFKKTGREMTENNQRQAYLPEDCIPIENKNGTAPGCIIEDNKKCVVMLPGPPIEMIPMFDDTVYPYLLNKTDSCLVSRMLKIFGIGESSFETMIMDLIDKQSNPTIAPYVSQGEISLRITARCKQKEEGYNIINPVIAEIKKRAAELVYSEDGQSMEEVVLELLKENNLTISTAESCTGGMLAEKITSVIGASSVFYRGYITYANKAKEEDLNVSSETLNLYGAVSSETAQEMVKGLKGKTGSDVVVAITGIAGPDGGTVEKPVGLVYIAVNVNNKIQCKEFMLMGNRNRVRNMACLNALNMIRLNLID